MSLVKWGVKFLVKYLIRVDPIKSLVESKGDNVWARRKEQNKKGRLFGALASCFDDVMARYVLAIGFPGPLEFLRANSMGLLLSSRDGGDLG